MSIHPFVLNIFEKRTGLVVDKNKLTSDDLKNCIPLLTMNFANRRLTLGDVFEFSNLYFIFSGYKEHISTNLPDIKYFNFIIIEKWSELFNDDSEKFNSYEFEHAILEDIDKKKFEKEFEFICNYFCTEKSIFNQSKIISMYMKNNNNFGVKFKNKGSILFKLFEKPFHEVQMLLNEPFTFYIITGFRMFDTMKMLNVTPGDIYSFIKVTQEQQQLVDYFLRKNKLTQKQLDNTIKYYSSIIHILDENCELKQVSINHCDFSEESKYFIDYIPNLFWLTSFEKIEFNLENKNYLEKYLFLIS